MRRCRALLRNNICAPLTPNSKTLWVYFDAHDLAEETERELEQELNSKYCFNWSVKNQAKMHDRNGDEPYDNTVDAMRYWPEVETAVGVSLDPSGKVKFVSPYSLDLVFRCSVTLNKNFKDKSQFQERLDQKGWLEQWPNLKLTVVESFPK